MFNKIIYGYTPHPIIAEVDVNRNGGMELARKLRLSGNSRCMHFFTLPDDLVMAMKIKPQRSQKNIESCYFHLSSPLYHSVPYVIFQNLISKISKISGVLVTATRDTKDPKLIGVTEDAGALEKWGWGK